MEHWTVVPCERGELYESARWVPDARVFQWVDILGGTIHRWSPREPDSAVESRHLGLEFLTMALPLDASRSIVASRSSLHQYDWTTHGLDQIGTWNFPADVRFNDGSISPTGEVFIGTMSMAGRPDAGCLYRFAEGELSPVLERVGISNGMCWASSSRAYYVDSMNPRIDALTLVGQRVERTVWIDLDQGDEPDGMTILRDGTVLAANWGRGAIECISRDGRRSRLPVPVRFPTSVAVSDDEEWMLVTSAAHGESVGDRDGQVLVRRTRGGDDYGE